MQKGPETFSVHVDLFFALLTFAGMIPLCIGILTIIWWFKAPPEPNDQSNRLNNVASWWIGLTRPQVMGRAYRYFRQDVMDNVLDVENRREVGGVQTGPIREPFHPYDGGSDVK